MTGPPSAGGGQCAGAAPAPPGRAAAPFPTAHQTQSLDARRGNGITECGGQKGGGGGDPNDVFETWRGYAERASVI